MCLAVDIYSSSRVDGARASQFANGVTEGPIAISNLRRRQQVNDPTFLPATRIAPSHENTFVDDRAQDRLLRAVPRCLHRCHVANAGTRRTSTRKA